MNRRTLFEITSTAANVTALVEPLPRIQRGGRTYKGDRMYRLRILDLNKMEAHMITVSRPLLSQVMTSSKLTARV